MSATQNSSAKKRGLLIVVEGLDRSGKTTQCETLCKDLRDEGMDVKYIKFPDRTTDTGQMINAYLKGKAEQNDEAIHLLFSANRWEAVKAILNDLQSGCTIIVDRYSFSGAVYSAAKENPHLSLEWCWNPEVGLPKPDLVLFLDIASEDAAKRGGYGEERYEQQDMQVRVRALFKSLFTRLPNLNVRTINAGSSQDDVATQIRTAYQDLRKADSAAQRVPVLSNLSKS